MAEGVAKVHPGLCDTRKGKNAIFPFLAETTTWRRRFWQHIHVLHDVAATLSLLRQPLAWGDRTAVRRQNGFG